MTARRTVELVGGPLDGHRLDVTGWTLDELETGVAHIVDGWIDRACYAPPAGEVGAARWPYEGDLP